MARQYNYILWTKFEKNNFLHSSCMQQLFFSFFNILKIFHRISHVINRYILFHMQFLRLSIVFLDFHIISLSSLTLRPVVHFGLNLFYSVLVLGILASRRLFHYTFKLFLWSVFCECKFKLIEKLFDI